MQMGLAKSRGLGSRRTRDVVPLLAGGAPLPAGGFQHLLMLLLAHPLAAFFDQRAHVWAQVSGFTTHHVKIGFAPLASRAWIENRLGLLR